MNLDFKSTGLTEPMNTIIHDHSLTSALAIAVETEMARARNVEAKSAARPEVTRAAQRQINYRLVQCANGERSNQLVKDVSEELLPHIPPHHSIEKQRSQPTVK
jgi:hypothetical protein